MTVRRPSRDHRPARSVKQSSTEPTYDAYPDRALAPPRVRLALVAVPAEADFDAEWVDTDELSVREWLPAALEYPKRAHWLVTRLDEAHRRLLQRIGPNEGEPD